MTHLDSLIADLGRLNSPYIAGECVGATRAGATEHVDPSTGQPVAVVIAETHEQAQQSAERLAKVVTSALSLH